MKKQILPFIAMALASLLIFTACKTAAKTDRIETGDLLFVALPLDYDAEDSTSIAEAIASSTGHEDQLNFIHVAILEQSDDTTFVIDATIKRGVARYPLDTMKNDFRLRSGEFPIFVVKRVSGKHDSEGWINNAKQYIGRAYDMAFLPDNQEQYCSELVRNSYLSSEGDTIFPSAPMNFKSADGTYPAYWVWLFEKLDMPIPQGISGTNPNDMARDSRLLEIKQ